MLELDKLSVSDIELCDYYIFLKVENALKLAERIFILEWAVHTSLLAAETFVSLRDNRRFSLHAFQLEYLGTLSVYRDQVINPAGGHCQVYWGRNT